jgi:hypothetical protein
VPQVVFDSTGRFDYGHDGCGHSDTERATVGCGRDAAAHRDSIQRLGAAYPPSVVDDWQAGLIGDVYRKAIDGGEVFFIATGTLDGERIVLGFASDYSIDGPNHGTSVHVRGAAARCGTGSGLLRDQAMARRAKSVHVEASLAGVEPDRANGFIEVSRGATRRVARLRRCR